MDGTAPKMNAAQVTSRTRVSGHASPDTLLDFYLFGKRLRQIHLFEEGMSREEEEQQEAQVQESSGNRSTSGDEKVSFMFLVRSE